MFILCRIFFSFWCLYLLNHDRYRPAPEDGGATECSSSPKKTRSAEKSGKSSVKSKKGELWLGMRTPSPIILEYVLYLLQIIIAVEGLDTRETLPYGDSLLLGLLKHFVCPHFCVYLSVGNFNIHGNKILQKRICRGKNRKFRKN